MAGGTRRVDWMKGTEDEPAVLASRGVGGERVVESWMGPRISPR